MNSYNKLQENLDNQFTNYNKLLTFELNKIDAVHTNNIEYINQITEEESSLLELLSSLEGERLGLVCAMGYNGCTMSQLLPLVSDDQTRYKLTATFNDLSSILNKLRETVNISQNLAAINLHFSELILKSLENPPKPVLYKSDGTVSSAKDEPPRHKFKNSKI